MFFFFVQAEDGIRDFHVTGVQTCALPIFDDRDMLVVSDFQWTGNHFGPAPPQTQRWWKRMRGWIDKTAVRLEGTSGFWAFPSALQKLKNGMRYYARGFDLDQAIRTAKV